MTDSSDPTHRSLIDPPADSVTLREAEEVEGDDDMMEVRMPIASTGEVRNEGDDPLSADELRGMARQINNREVGIFPEHGAGNFMSAGKYSQFEKLGYWDDADLEQEAAADGADLLMATARMPDPETLPAATGDYRSALGIVKEQAKRGIPISASIGWREDEDSPGGNDLMEASIVGIGADPRTATEGGTEALARAAVDAGADPETFVERVAELVDAGERDTDHDMSDDTDTGDEAGTTDDEQDGRDMNDQEYREFMRDQQEQQTEILRTLAESLREDDDKDDEDDDDEDDEDDDDEEQSSDEPESEQSADGDESESTEQSADDDDIAERVAELEAELEAVRSGDVDVDTPETDEEQSADESDDSEDEQTREAPDPTGGLGDYR